jgi:hypothetical protein
VFCDNAGPAVTSDPRTVSSMIRDWNWLDFDLFVIGSFLFQKFLNLSNLTNALTWQSGPPVQSVPLAFPDPLQQCSTVHPALGTKRIDDPVIREG